MVTNKRQRPARPSGRDADPRRTIPLNSSRWRKLRACVLSGEPLCRHCKARGVVTMATDVDHADGNPGNNDPSNLQALCHECHSRKTTRERHGLPADMPGCNADGWPADPAHHWNR